MKGYHPKYALGIASAFIEYKGKFLLTFDPKFGFWRVPGGRIEKNESPEETLKREINEELGISIHIGKFVGFGKDYVWVKPEKRWRSRLIIYFWAKTNTNKLKMLKNEVSKVKWVSLNKIKKIKPLEPAMKDLFKRFNLIKPP